MEQFLTTSTFKEGCGAQRKHSFFPPSSPKFESLLRCGLLSLLLSLLTVLRSRPSSAKQWISQMHLAVTSRALHNKKYFKIENVYLVGRHSTEVVFGLVTQPSRVRISTLLRNVSVEQCYEERCCLEI